MLPVESIIAPLETELKLAAGASPLSLSVPGNGIYGVYSFFQLFESFPALHSCTKTYGVSSVPFGGWVGNEIKTLHFKWSKPNCIKCEAEGKRCRLKNNGTKSEIEFVDRRKPSKTKMFPREQPWVHLLCYCWSLRHITPIALIKVKRE